MALIRDIVALFQNKNILVDIDPILLPLIKCPDKVTIQRIISFNLYRLIYHIGTIQSRRFATSNRLKFLDKVDLIEKIYTNTNEFRIKVNEIRQINGSETLISISEDFGIGVSVVVSESLFNIRRATIQKIYGTKKRPDWKCQLIDNRILVVEGKGSTSMQTSYNQEARALIQKTKEPGDIRVASLTVLNENGISTTRYLDPPVENDNISPEMQNHILRAGHYASVFSFLGNSKLSRYYSQMRNRLEGLITAQDQNLKDQTFRELRMYAPTVSFKNQNFVGSFYNIEDQKYLFVGVDKRLLSYQGFISYEEFENDFQDNIEENVFVLYKDGILIIEITNINNFRGIVNINAIESYQKNITISDIDEMNEISFSKYFQFVLRENGFTDINEETTTNNLLVDLSAKKNNETYFFEFKIFKSKRIGRGSIQQILEFRRRIEVGKLVLVTNARLNNIIIEEENLIVIDRDKLYQLAKNSSILLELIG